jgi:hypothetical protein
VDENGDKVCDAAIEIGFVRPKADGSFEWLPTHNTGFAVIWLGTAESAKIQITTDAVVRTKTAKEYVGAHRPNGLGQSLNCVLRLDTISAMTTSAVSRKAAIHVRISQAREGERWCVHRKRRTLASWRNGSVSGWRISTKTRPRPSASLLIVCCWAGSNFAIAVRVLGADRGISQLSC